ncbi:MAG: serine/threonine protein kinase [Pseudomonadota bacterium]
MEKEPTPSPSDDTSDVADLDQTLIQDDEGLARSADRSSSLARPEVPGYEVGQRLGAGSYGEVWLATQKNTGRRVAIKFFSQQKGLDFPLLKREVEKLVEVLSERRVVHLLEVGWDADPPYYVMEYLAGGSLADRLGGRPLSIDDSVAVFAEVGEALAYLHGKAILHCDLKPANVLLNDENQIRLADFGQARLSSEQGPAVGTLFYMAPEQARPKSRPDARSDIYALGALLYCMITGRPPYASEKASRELKSSTNTWERIERYVELIESSPAPRGHHENPNVDRPLRDIIDRCITVDPEERFQTVQEVLGALAARAKRATLRPLVLFGVLGPLVLLAGMAGIGVWAWQQAESQAEATISSQSLTGAAGFAELVSAVVDRNLSATKRRVSREAGTPVLAQGLQALSQGQAEATQVLQSELERLHENYRDRSFFSWVLADANGVAIARAPLDERVIGSRYAYREWFTGKPQPEDVSLVTTATPRQTTGITRAFESTSAERPILVSVGSPVWLEVEDASPQVVGVLAATLHLPTFNEWLREAEGDAKPGECADRYAVLLNDGQLVRHPCPGEVSLPLGPAEFLETPAVQALMDSEAGRSDRFEDPVNGTEMLAAYQALGANPKWQVVVQQSREAALSPLTGLSERFRTLGWVAAGLGLVLVGILWFFLFRVTRDGSLLQPQRKDGAAGLRLDDGAA